MKHVRDNVNSILCAAAAKIISQMPTPKFNFPFQQLKICITKMLFFEKVSSATLRDVFNNIGNRK
jgi:hypothetical protein